MHGLERIMSQRLCILSPWTPIERTHRFPFAPDLVPCRSLSALIILEPINHLTSEPPPATTSLFLSFSRGESPSYPDPREGTGTPARIGETHRLGDTPSKKTWEVAG